MKSINLKLLFTIITIFILTRSFLFFLSAIGPKIIPEWGNRYPYVHEYLISTRLSPAIWSFGGFDGVHYLTIAKTSYSADYTQTFFPLYPLMIRFVATFIIPNHYLISALLVSNISFLLLMYMFSKLLEEEKLGKQLFWVLVFLVTFPTAFYYNTIYTESFFLALTVCSFYFAKKKNWLASGICGGLASFTRLFGLFIFPALLYKFYTDYRRLPKTKVNLFHLASIFIVPLGTLIYMTYLYFAAADPLVFWHDQPAFGAARSGGGIILPPQVIYRYLKILLTVSSNQLAYWNALYELAAFLFASAVLLFGYKKIHFSYQIYSWLALLVPALTGTLSSMPRYVAIIFPMYIILAMIKSKILKIALALIFIIIQAAGVILFTRGYWVS